MTFDPSVYLVECEAKAERGIAAAKAAGNAGLVTQLTVELVSIRKAIRFS